MKKRNQKAVLFSSMLAGITAIAMLNACGNGNHRSAEVAPGGFLVQGPVSGATVWADNLSAGTAGVQDSDEVFTTTDSKGEFRYTRKPNYPYISRSKGGIDTITNKPALPLAAPAGSTTITPITSLIASIAPNADGSLSAAQNSLVTKIESIMGGEKFDSDPTKKTTPAALALTKSIETAMTVASKAVSESAATSAAPPTANQLTEIEKTVTTAVVAAIATQISNDASATTTLSNANSLAAAVSTATQTAATTLTTNQATSNVVFYDTAALKASVQTAVTSVATDIADASGQTAADMGTASNTKVQEATIIQPLAAQIETAQSIATDSTVESVAAVAPVADTTAPVVSSVTPAESATGVPVKAPVTVNFTKAMDPATLTAANITIVGPGGVAVPFTVGYNSSTNTAILTPNADLAANAAYTVTVDQVKDLSAKLPITAAKSWSFTTAAVVDTVPPTATLAPAASAANVAVSSSVTAIFNKAVTASTVNGTNFTVTKGGVAVPGTVRYNQASLTATFVPALPLSYGTTYTVNLSGITSLSGTTMAPTTTTFSTLASPDTVKPTATFSTVPAAGSNGRITRSASFTATFSEKLDPTTINRTTFTLKYKAGTGTETIAGAVSYNTVTNVATFTPSAALPENRIVIATVTTGVTDLAGNALAALVSKEFTTELTATGSTGGSAF